MIEACSFGSITIEGKNYTKDVLITQTGVLSPWWRGEGHRLAPEDLESMLASPPEILVIGTGSFGVMKVPEETLDFLKEKGMEPRVMRTGRAADEFNSLVSKLGTEKVAAALHLTC